jgi:TonB family protein
MREIITRVGVAAIILTTISVGAQQTGQDSGAPIRVGGDVEPPIKTRDVPPVYPPEAQAARVEGVVVIEATVGLDGRVTGARVIRSVPQLDQAALEAVRQWEFAPTVLDGKPVSVVLSVTVNFSLGGAGGRSPSGSDRVSAGSPRPASDTCAQDAADTPEYAGRRQAAVRFVEDVHARQRTALLARQGERYAAFDELPAGEAPPGGFDVQVVADRRAYAVSLKDTQHPCGLTFFSDQGGVIYVAVPVRN